MLNFHVKHWDIQFQTQWCYTWSTTKSHSKKSVVFLVLLYYVLGVFRQKHGQNSQNLTARCTSQSTSTRMLSPWRWPQLSHVEPNAPCCCCPENQDALTDIYNYIYIHIYTSHFFLWWVFSWFDLEIFSGKFMIMTSNLTLINLRNNKSPFISNVPYRSL